MTRRERSRLIATLAVAAFCALSAGASRAHAEDPRASAEALFREGRALLARGEIAAACDSFARSQALDASGGTLMNLADCHEKQGKLATAWSEFVMAEAFAREQGRIARAKEAKRRAAALSPRLSTLTIVVGQPPPDLEVHRDGEKLSANQLGVAVPLDPGEHRVTASAPGHTSVSLGVTIGAERDAQTLSVPALQPEPPPETPAPVVPAPATEPLPIVLPPPGASRLLEQPREDSAAGGSDKATLGWIVGGTGAALATAGTVFYFLSLDADREAAKGCGVRSQFRCSPAAIEAERRRDTYSTLATIGGVAGIVGIGAGAWLVLTAPSSGPVTGKPASRKPQLAATLGPYGASLVVRGVVQ